MSELPAVPAAFDPFANRRRRAPRDVRRAERIRERNGVAGTQRHAPHPRPWDLRDLDDVAVGGDGRRGLDVEFGRQQIHCGPRAGKGLLMDAGGGGEREDRGAEPVGLAVVVAPHEAGIAESEQDRLARGLVHLGRGGDLGERQVDSVTAGQAGEHRDHTARRGGGFDRHRHCSCTRLTTI